MEGEDRRRTVFKTRDLRMNIAQTLASGHTKQNTLAIVDYIGDDEKRFAELIRIFFGGEYRLTQRAAWPLSYCAERRPELIKPHLSKLLNCLESKTEHVAARRNVVRLLQFIEIPRRHAGRIYSCCLDLLDDPHEPIAVRVFAITVAARIARMEPDLLNELRLVIRKHLPHATAAFKVRAREVL